jgi:hypothetical protein
MREMIDNLATLLEDDNPFASGTNVRGASLSFRGFYSRGLKFCD